MRELKCQVCFKKDLFGVEWLPKDKALWVQACPECAKVLRITRGFERQEEVADNEAVARWKAKGITIGN